MFVNILSFYYSDIVIQRMEKWEKIVAKFYKCCRKIGKMARRRRKFFKILTKISKNVNNILFFQISFHQPKFGGPTTPVYEHIFFYYKIVDIRKIAKIHFCP